MNIVPQLILNSIIAGSIIAFLAVSFNLIYGATRFFNMAHGTVAIFGGYIAFFFFKTLGWNMYLSAILGILAAGLLGYIFDRIIYLPLRKRKASGMIMLVASIGVFTALQSLIQIFFTSEFQTLSDISVHDRLYTIFGATITQTQIYILIMAFIVAICLIIFLKYTIFGKAVKAISDDEEVAKIVGINTNKIIGLLFFIGSGIAAIGGIAVGFDTGLNPTMGMKLLLHGISAAIIGGVGSVYGAFIGAFVLTFVANFSIFWIPGEWQEAVAFVLLIIFLIFRPRGIIKR
ncbi:MAG: Inner-membrane translocator [Candidatus Peregrinibacteria bacterium GW2011_GWA2_38_36]|nr:MAG: Inner-membrane translocator [Candidatus Peregrinibacteria bacterium GW2011_GWA2_38_36]